jgi:hypothetical protein
MKRTRNVLFNFAQAALGVVVLITMGKEIGFTLTTYECSFRTSFNFVDLKMVESLNVFNKLIFFLGLSRSTTQVMSVVIISTISENFILVKVILWRSQHNCVR